MPDPFTRATLLDFRDQLIAASLKQQILRTTANRLAHFRDQLIAASLKLRSSERCGACLRHFRDQLIAASLKRQRRDALRRQIVQFPRSIDRGLIEALYARVISATDSTPFPRSIDRGLIEAARAKSRPVPPHAFPRSIDRGLIEAPRLRRTWRRRLHFRDQLIAASLKHRLPLRPHAIVQISAIN